MIRQAVIGAGGSGTRMAGVLPDKPKILAEISGRTLLEHSLVNLSQFGIQKVHLLLGVFADQVISSIPNLRSIFELDITYSVESSPLGTAGSILNASAFLEDSFLFFYGDLYINTDFTEILEALENPGVEFAQLVHPSNHVFDSDLIISNDQSLILGYLVKPHPPELVFNNLSNAGVYAFRKRLFSHDLTLKFSSKIDLDKELLPYFVANGVQGKTCRNYGFVRDAGTPSRLNEINEKYINGSLAMSSRPAIFLDRDGTLNIPNGHITVPENFEIYPDVGPFISMANRAGYWVIVITNQPVIARGEASMNDLKLIHAKFESEIARDNAYVDAIFVCPHHPHSGFPNEIRELKFSCTCRKPEIGLFQNAIQQFGINIEKSFFIGDSWRDEEAASKVSIKFIRMNRTGIESSIIHPSHIPFEIQSLDPSLFELMIQQD